MATIEGFDLLKDYQIFFRFTDGTEKTIDFKPWIKSDSLTRLLADPTYFGQVKLYERGSGIYWPNGYDFDPTYLKDYVQGEVLTDV